MARKSMPKLGQRIFVRWKYSEVKCSVIYHSLKKYIFILMYGLNLTSGNTLNQSGFAVICKEYSETGLVE